MAAVLLKRVLNEDSASWWCCHSLDDNDDGNGNGNGYFGCKVFYV